MNILAILIAAVIYQTAPAIPLVKTPNGLCVPQAKASNPGMFNNLPNIIGYLKLFLSN
jgi:hypothetical protein